MSGEQEQRFDSCQTYCSGKFHTTSCSAKRGMRPSKMDRRWRGNQGSRLIGMLRPFMFSAVGRGIKDDAEVLNFAAQELYAVAVEAGFLTVKDQAVMKEIADIRQRLGR